MRIAALLAGSLAVTACFASPTPLAPGLRGSIGTPDTGTQTGAVELPKQGTGFRRYRPNSPMYWGNPRLVAAIEHAAAVVAAELPGGAPLYIGDLSARTGGDIPGHASHENGRDGDLLFYVTTPAGAPVRSPGFVHFDTDGLAWVTDKSFVRIDIPREWLLVKTLVTHSDDVEWLFCSRGIESQLIDYARARGEDDELVWHAETVLLQPGDSAPHDDHLHFRLTCSPDDAVHGCEGGGPHWDWLPKAPELGELDEATLDAIASDDPLGVESATSAQAP